jgi:sec-independent protein translocase protein TatA
VLLLFGGKGKVSDLMGDFAKGIKSFKKGLADDDSDKDKAAPAEAKTLDQPTASLNQKASEPVGEKAKVG